MEEILALGEPPRAAMLGCQTPLTVSRMFPSMAAVAVSARLARPRWGERVARAARLARVESALVAPWERVERRRFAREAQPGVRVTACRLVRTDSGARRSPAGHVRPAPGRWELPSVRATWIPFAPRSETPARAHRRSPTAHKTPRPVSTSRQPRPAPTGRAPARPARHRVARTRVRLGRRVCRARVFRLVPSGLTVAPPPRLQPARPGWSASAMERPLARIRTGTSGRYPTVKWT